MKKETRTYYFSVEGETEKWYLDWLQDVINSTLSHRRQYLAPLNHAYGENFEDLDQYKHKDNFRRVLGNLTLSDVRQAIRRSEAIMKQNQDNGYILQQHRGYNFYQENPSLSLWETIKRILSDCGLA